MQPEMSHEDEQRWIAYYRALREWASYLVGPRLRRRLDESDLAQESWAAAWESRDKFRGKTPEEWECWLRGILRNKLANALRLHMTRRRDVRREAALPNQLDQSWTSIDAMFFGNGPGPLQQLEREERIAKFIEAAAGLPDKEQVVIRLRLFEGLKLTEIADRLGETEGAVAGRLARATRRLQDRLAGTEV